MPDQAPDERTALSVACRVYQEDNRPAGYAASLAAGWQARGAYERQRMAALIRAVSRHTACPIRAALAPVPSEPDNA